MPSTFRNTSVRVAVAVGALFIAAVVTVITGPRVTPLSQVTPSPSPTQTPIPGPSGLPLVVTLATSSRAGVLYAVVGEEPSRLMRSTDSGLTWSVVSPQLPLAGATRGFDELIADPVTPGAFYLVRGATIYRFTDDDTTLRPVPAPAGAVPDPFMGTFAIPPWQEGTIVRRSAQRLVSLTYDGGRTWSAVSLPGPVKALAAAPSRPGHMYAFIDRVVWESWDYGQKWFRRSASDPPAFGSAVAPSLAVYPNDEYLLFAGTLAGLYVSPDGGQVWSLAWTAPPPTPGTIEAGWRFAFDPRGFDVYATRLTPRDNPTLVSRDRGRTWEESRLSTIGARQVIFTAWPSAPVFVATANRGIFVGDAKTQAWMPRSEGLAPGP